MKTGKQGIGIEVALVLGRLLTIRRKRTEAAWSDYGNELSGAVDDVRNQSDVQICLEIIFSVQHADAFSSCDRWISQQEQEDPEADVDEIGEGGDISY